jgi:hypothetical protein
MLMPRVGPHVIVYHNNYFIQYNNRICNSVKIVQSFERLETLRGIESRFVVRWPLKTDNVASIKLRRHQRWLSSA